jgi:hypothetical protein
MEDITLLGDHAVFLDFPNQLSKYEKLLLFHKWGISPYLPYKFRLRKVNFSANFTVEQIFW